MQNQSYAGAAGGIGGALWAMLDASLTPGIYAMLKAINFEARIADADIVVTGEGAMDSLTLLGKAPYGVCGEAAWNGIPTIAFVGSVSDSDSLNEYGFLSVYPTVPGPMPLEEAMKPDVAYANSVWVLVDTRTGRPVKVPQEFADTYGLEPQLEMECAKRKLHIPDDMEKKGEIVVPQFFIDSNHHMNNEKYVMLAQQLLPNEKYVILTAAFCISGCCFFCVLIYTLLFTPFSVT